MGKNSDDYNVNTVTEINDDEYMRLLRSGPIADFAEYIGVDIDLAVKLRIDDAVDMTYDKVALRQGVIAQDIYTKWESEHSADMVIAVRPIVPQGNLFGFVSIKIGGITVDDIKILENKSGDLFVGMPSKPDKTSKTGYRNTVSIDKGMREIFNAAVLCAYRESVEQAKTHSAAGRGERAGQAGRAAAEQIGRAGHEEQTGRAAVEPSVRAEREGQAGRAGQARREGRAGQAGWLEQVEHSGREKPRIADQIAKAEQNFNRHNTATTAPAYAIPARDSR
jgi:DNA-binding cell septation regulator SpoVG